MTSLPHLALTDFDPHVAAINQLADAGWTLCINHLGAQWHVSLTHQSLGRDTVTIHGDGVQTSAWGDSPLNIHAHSRLLGAALEQAISEAGAQPVSP